MGSLPASLEKTGNREVELANQALEMVRASAQNCLSLAARSPTRALQFTLQAAGRICEAAVRTLEVFVGALVPREDPPAEPRVRVVAPFRPADSWRPGEEDLPEE